MVGDFKSFGQSCVDESCVGGRKCGDCVSCELGGLTVRNGGVRDDIVNGDGW